MEGLQATMNAAFSHALALRARLHEIPEASGCEVMTKQLLMDDLKDVCEVHDCGKWFYAAHREEEAESSLCFRADMDAVSGGDGNVYHGCGHDGHMSVMAALAHELAGRQVGKTSSSCSSTRKKPAKARRKRAGSLTGKASTRSSASTTAPAFRKARSCSGTTYSPAPRGA